MRKQTMICNGWRYSKTDVSGHRLPDADGVIATDVLCKANDSYNIDSSSL